MVDHADEGPDEAAPGQAGGDAEDAGGLPGEGERVAKALARAGVASRRDVERYIAAGRVALNGRVLSTPAVKVGAGDILTVDGRVVEGAEATRVWRHHKPAGLLTSHGDPQGRPTVFEHLPEGMPRVISVGRLDLATEGLLLLTNDGELARALERPSNAWKRTYRARAYGRADPARLEALKDGVTLEGVRYGPIEARIDKATGPGAAGRGRLSDAPANLWITVTVSEGKNREVRRVLESLGLKVNRLIRLAYGPFALGTLGTGEVEEVGPRVLREQLAGLIAPENMPKGDRRPVPAAAGRAPPPVAPVRRAAPAGKAAAFKGERPAGEGKPFRGERPTGKGARFKDERPAGKGAPSRTDRSARPSGPVGKPPPRPTGGAGRVGGAWTPPGERKAAGKSRAPGRGPERAGEVGRGSLETPRPFRAGPGAKPGVPARAPAPAPQGRYEARSRPDERAAPGRPGGEAFRGKPAGGGPKPGRPPAVAKADAPPKRTGMELTPPMRRTPRRKDGPKGPGRPPRGD